MAQDLGYGGERLGELLVGTPSLMVVKLLLHPAACDQGIMGIVFLDAGYSFLNVSMRRRVCVELPERDDMPNKGNSVGRLCQGHVWHARGATTSV